MNRGIAIIVSISTLGLGLGLSRGQVAPARTGTPGIVRPGVTNIAPVTAASTNITPANTNSGVTIAQPGRETTIGQQGSTAIGRQGTIIGVGLGLTNSSPTATATNSNTTGAIGQPGRETAIGEQGSTAIGQQGSTAIGRQGTIIGIGLGMTNTGSPTTTTNTSGAIGQPGRETAIGEQGSTAIGQQGITAIGKQGTIIGIGLGMTNVDTGAKNVVVSPTNRLVGTNVSLGTNGLGR